MYKFEYLPAGLFNRVQVRLYQFSESGHMWKTGSVLKKNGHMAVIKQTKQVLAFLLLLLSGINIYVFQSDKLIDADLLHCFF